MFTYPIVNLFARCVVKCTLVYRRTEIIRIFLQKVLFNGKPVFFISEPYRICVFQFEVLAWCKRAAEWWKIFVQFVKGHSAPEYLFHFIFGLTVCTVCCHCECGWYRQGRDKSVWFAVKAFLKQFDREIAVCVFKSIVGFYSFVACGFDACHKIRCFEGFFRLTSREGESWRDEWTCDYCW